MNNGKILFALLFSILALATTLWISDDVTQIIYRVAGDGVLLASFRSPASRPSSTAINPTDGTLWSAVEGFSPNFPGGVVNYTRAGTLLAAIPENLYGGVGTEGVAVDFFDDTLWTVDDREPGAATGPPMIFNIDRKGTVIRSYQSFAFDLLNPASPNSVARISPFWRDVWERNTSHWFLQAGQYSYTPDHRPFLGPTPVEGLYLNCGYSGHGIMASAGGSRLAVDTLTGALSPEDNPFRLDRPMAPREQDLL